MKKFYHALAIAAIAAVSMFSAQSAKAQLLRSAPIASVDTEATDDEDDPVLASSIEDDLNDALFAFQKQLFMGQLEYYKEHNTKVTKSEALDLLKEGRQLGISDMVVLSYLTNIAPY